MHKISYIILLFLLLLVIRASAPVDLFEGDQRKQVGYVMDILFYGNLAIQYEVNGYVATKPPFYNWCAALFCIILGSTAPWVMKLPSLLAGIGFVIMIYLIARKYFDSETALWASLTCIASHHFSKLFWFARTDMLMAFGLYLAIFLTIQLKGRWYKSLLIGAVLGINFLTKGLVGPPLYLGFLIIWAIEQKTIKQPRKWIGIIPGLFIFALISIVWLSIVWYKPQFQQGVLGRELAARFTGGLYRTQPFYFYIPILFARIAPWTVLAIGVCIYSYYKKQWKKVRFFVIWFALYFIFFSSIPTKRHDHLLPIYPIVFILAGYAIKIMFEKEIFIKFSWIFTAVGSMFIITSGILPFIIKRENFIIISLFVLMGVIGIILILTSLKSQKKTVCLILFLVGMIIANGFYYNGIGNYHLIHSYSRMEKFLDRVRPDVKDNQVVLWKVHPLFAYNLGIHPRTLRLKDIKNTHPKWFITDDREVKKVKRITGWKLQEVGHLNLKEKKVSAKIFTIKL